MKKITALIGLLVLLFLNIIVWQIDLKSARGDLKVSFLNVGQGDAIFIQAPNGNQVLIDGGKNSAVVKELSRVMPFYDRSIDLVIGTHADFDHMGGLIDVFDRYQVARFGHSGKGDNGDEPDSEFYEILFDRAETEILEELILERGQKIVLDSENQIELQILWPADEFVSSDNNENSVVIRLVYKKFAVMLTGDLGKENEEVLVELAGENTENSLRLGSDILKAGHHGSKTSTSEKFLKAVSPEFVIISAKEDSRYGHPHQEVIERIKNFEIKNGAGEFSQINSPQILETKNGTITFISDGTTFYKKPPRGGFDFLFDHPGFF